MCRLWSHPGVCRYIGGRPSTDEETWNRLLRYAGLWRLLGYGYLAIEDRATGAYLGDIGLADFRRAMEPPLPDVPEAGWALDPAVHGRGLAREALEALLGWADRRLRTAIVCIVSPDNGPSLRLAARCGFEERRRARFRSEETVVFERPGP